MPHHKLHLLAFNALRASLAIVFLWFGLLKFFNVSPVLSIIAEAYPFIAEKPTLYLILAIAEIVIAIGILIPRYAIIFYWMVVGHLSVATLGVLFSSQAFQPVFPFLSLTGEFVVKNFVLISAALVLISHDGELSHGQEEKT